MIFAGASTYAERWPRWRVESVRWTVLISAVIVITPIVAFLLWIVRARRDAPHAFWWLKSLLLMCAIGFLLPVLGVMNIVDRELGTRNIWTTAMFAGTLLLPAAAVLSFLFVIEAWRTGAGRWLRAYALIVALAALVISGYLSAWGMIAFRPWSF